MKVFLDTNVLVSATATRGLCADVLRNVVASQELVISSPLLEELKRVLKETFRAPPELVADVLWLLQQDTIVAEARPTATNETLRRTANRRWGFMLARVFKEP